MDGRGRVVLLARILGTALFCFNRNSSTIDANYDLKNGASLHLGRSIGLKKSLYYSEIFFLI